jgi:hypothetical protein
MNKIYPVLIVAFVVLSTACSSITKDIRVKVGVDSKANFSGYESYAWLATAKIVHDPVGRWEPPEFDADAEIKFLIDRELRKHGMVESTQQPDLAVGFLAGVDMAALKLKKNPDTDMLRLENVPQGALAIVLVDVSTGFAVWIGNASGELQGKKITSDDARKRLDFAVTKMLALLPEK